MNTYTSTLTTTSVVTPRVIVEFEYPDSKTQKMKLRYLRVTSADADHIKGYELDNAGSQKDGQFKTFSRNRLTRNSPTLVTF